MFNIEFWAYCAKANQLFQPSNQVDVSTATRKTERVGFPCIAHCGFFQWIWSVVSGWFTSREVSTIEKKPIHEAREKFAYLAQEVFDEVKEITDSNELDASLQKVEDYLRRGGMSKSLQQLAISQDPSWAVRIVTKIMITPENN